MNHLQTMAGLKYARVYLLNKGRYQTFDKTGMSRAHIRQIVSMQRQLSKIIVV